MPRPRSHVVAPFGCRRHAEHACHVAGRLRLPSAPYSGRHTPAQSASAELRAGAPLTSEVGQCWVQRETRADSDKHAPKKRTSEKSCVPFYTPSPFTPPFSSSALNFSLADSYVAESPAKNPRNTRRVAKPTELSTVSPEFHGSGRCLSGAHALRAIYKQRQCNVSVQPFRACRLRIARRPCSPRLTISSTRAIRKTSKNDQKVRTISCLIERPE